MAKSVRKTVKKTLKKVLKKRQGGANLYGIKQGAGKVTNRAFPKRTTARSPQHLARLCLNAMHPRHLPLPRAVGGYMVVRTTDIINTSNEAVLFGCFKGPGNEFTETCWLTNICVTNADGAVDLPIGSDPQGANARVYASQALGAASMNGARMVPAAITVQVMNGESLQTADGIAYIGRSKTVLDLMGDSRTWATVMKELVAYSAPRLCSGGKLALRGVQVNGIPNNLSVLSDFVPRRVGLDSVVQWRQSNFQADFEGFGPIFVYNPDKIGLKYLVTVEWRVRFDPLNPAYAGHTVHAPAPESTWSRVIADAEAAGNGVMDIADVTADVGAVAAAARYLL